ncbi:FtsW/RodA/SpoVE family cell cycle protein [Alkalihalophilus marmarensis]|uniref:FtsW/RodA/SpoVE family cell cycle protein n=1 Tax=Alkalihalophilus marmarensis TaxID=521377 RepID=UPI002DB9EFA0|nr:FtsW/RodA/SpoVE family cell cycle protein [Alkalihalophilus marmarensis]MEC2073362.1 FtsW/RodA/SpoVE family cell cycle protein [Alkalihalophilus marmarensis]
MNAQFQTFLNAVKQQMKSKEGQKLVEKELLSHLNHSKQTVMKRGHHEEEAEKMAVEQMGNAVLLGQKMNKLHRERVDWWLVSIVGSLLLLSFAPFLFFDYQMNIYAQLISVSVSVLIIFTLMFIDYRKVLHYWIWFGLAAGFYMVALNVEGLTSMVNGRVFISILGMNISHYFLLFLLFITIVGLMSEKKWTDRKRIVWSLLLLFVFVRCFMLIPETMLAVQYIILFSTIVIFSNQNYKVRSWILWVLSGCIFFFGYLFVAFLPFSHRLENFISFLNPEASSNGSGYIYIMMKEVLSKAGLFGPKSELTNDLFLGHTELILVALTYHGGWILTSLILVIFAALSVRLLLAFKKMQTEKERLLMVGGGVLLLFPFVLNALMSFGYAPFVGANLPFISYGGNEKLYYSFIIGFMLSVYRRKDVMINTEVEIDK